MLVSEAAQICFVHIHRTGGTSITNLLKNALPDAKQMNLQHDNANTISPSDMDQYKGYYKFSFVRNPWERVLSWYALAYKFRGDKDSPFVSFETFVRDYERVRRVLRIDDSFMFNQVDYLSDGNGGLIVDAAGRYENYEDDLIRILSHCRIPFKEIPESNTTRHGPISTDYSEENRALVEKLCEKDIAYWGYRFS